MWVRGAAIRPVPRYAVVERPTLERIERELAEDAPRARADALKATEEAIELEEELRAAHGDEPLDLDDVVSIEQPDVLAFVHEHVDAALDPTTRPGAAEGAPGGAESREVDVDDVHAVYRATVLLTLCLSHAVVPLDGAARGREELLA
jgi:hypothetical protein